MLFRHAPSGWGTKVWQKDVVRVWCSMACIAGWCPASDRDAPEHWELPAGMLFTRHKRFFGQRVRGLLQLRGLLGCSSAWHCAMHPKRRPNYQPMCLDVAESNCGVTVGWYNATTYRTTVGSPFLFLNKHLNWTPSPPPIPPPATKLQLGTSLRSFIALFTGQVATSAA